MTTWLPFNGPDDSLTTRLDTLACLMRLDPTLDEFPASQRYARLVGLLPDPTGSAPTMPPPPGPCGYQHCEVCLARLTEKADKP